MFSCETPRLGKSFTFKRSDSSDPKVRQARMVLPNDSSLSSISEILQVQGMKYQEDNYHINYK